MRQDILKAMHDSDNLVVEFSYCDSKGQETRRVVSPIRFLQGGRFLGLCLGREEPRQFYLDRCSQLLVMEAHKFLMPVAI